MAPVLAAAEKDVLTDSTSRVKFMEHDCFTEQLVQGAGVYFFRWIFHNWSDKYSVEIPRNLIPALKSDVKIMIKDNVLPQPGVMSRWQEGRLQYVKVCLCHDVPRL